MLILKKNTDGTFKLILYIPSMTAGELTDNSLIAPRLSEDKAKKLVAHRMAFLYPFGTTFELTESTE